MENAMRNWIVVLALVLVTTGAMAQSIVDLDHVRQAVARGALLWDVREAGAYAKGHIPGAVNFGDLARLKAAFFGAPGPSGLRP